MVIDGAITIVGTANMDHRSFDLNFEVNAIIYSAEFGDQVKKSFHTDLRHSKKLLYEEWITRPIYVRLLERMARLFSPLL
jgi:cardiolipin synthase